MSDDACKRAHQEFERREQLLSGPSSGAYRTITRIRDVVRAERSQMNARLADHELLQRIDMELTFYLDKKEREDG